MALKDQLDADLKSAMKEKDQLKLSTVRMLKSAVKYREIELMKPLDDAGVQAEIVILQGYLPAQLGPEELGKLVEAAIARVGAQGPKDMGKVMKELQPEVQGKAEGKAVSDLVKQRLAKP